MSYKGLFLAAALALLSACDSSTPETPAAPSGKPAAQQDAARPALDKAELPEPLVARLQRVSQTCLDELGEQG